LQGLMRNDIVEARREVKGKDGDESGRQEPAGEHGIPSGLESGVILRVTLRNIGSGGLLGSRCRKGEMGRSLSARRKS